jgi:hypothetical protein
MRLYILICIFVIFFSFSLWFGSRNILLFIITYNSRFILLKTYISFILQKKNYLNEFFFQNDYIFRFNNIIKEKLEHYFFILKNILVSRGIVRRFKLVFIFNNLSLIKDVCSYKHQIDRKIL